MNKGYEYLKSVRKLTDEEIGHWHLLPSEECVQFPVIDYAGKYAFTIKRLFDGRCKYENPSESPVGFRVFGLEHAVLPIISFGCAIVVEGPMDVIAMHTFGFTNTVGCISNNLTRWQALQLRRWTNKLILLFDGDDGGHEGQKKTAEVLRKHTDFKFTAVRLSTGDPDSYVRKGANEAALLRDAIAKAWLKLKEANG